MRKHSKAMIAAGGLTAAIGVIAMAGGGSANAADANLVKNGDFEQVGPLGSGTSTALTWSEPSFPGENNANNPTGMYAPGMYTIATNPSSVHSQWTPFTGDNHMMIVNGMEGATEGNGSLVWAQDVTLPKAAETYPLWAGQNLAVGTIAVRPDPANPGKLCVNYVLDDEDIAAGWRITQTHLATADTAAGIPQSNGNPTPGQFKAANDTFAPGVTAKEYCNVKSGLVVAAHAVVTQTTPAGLVKQTQTAWAGDTKFNGKQWALYASYTPTDHAASYDFSMDATNVYPTTNAQLVVTINGQEIGTADLDGKTPGNLAHVTANDLALSGTAHIEIRNKVPAYNGNDFAIDNISLTPHQ